MISPEYAQHLARYNRWMNDKVYVASEQLSDAERKAYRGAFFKSIHSTLNHLLWEDAMWLGRFIQGTALERAMPSTPGNVDVYAEWHTLKTTRIALDEELIVWTGSLDTGWLTGKFSWYSGMTKTTRSKPSWLLITHIFNHQTHHRGQVTTLLAQQKLIWVRPI